MTTTPTPARPASLACLLFSLLLIAGCGGGYQLQGRVVEGGRNMTTVSPQDPRMTRSYGADAGEGDGIPAVTVTVVADADRASRRVVASTTTDDQGRFATPVDLAGPGILMHEVEVTARRAGFAGVVTLIELPKKSTRLLISMPAGADRIGSQKSILQETLDDADVYLRN